MIKYNTIKCFLEGYETFEQKSEKKYIYEDKDEDKKVIWTVIQKPEKLDEYEYGGNSYTKAGFEKVTIGFQYYGEGNDMTTALVQAVARINNGKSEVIGNKKELEAGTLQYGGENVLVLIDQRATDKVPIYGAAHQIKEPNQEEEKEKDKEVNNLYDTSDFRDSPWKKGEKTLKLGELGLNEKAAILRDNPTVVISNKDNNYEDNFKNISGQIFETVAIGFDKDNKISILGSIRWGWYLGDGKEYTILVPSFISKDNPSKFFTTAAEAWNTNKSRIKIPTPIKKDGDDEKKNYDDNEKKDYPKNNNPI